MSTYPFQAEIEHPDRRIDMERVHNFRDLGGYPTSDGRVTKWRTLFRSDGLHRLRGDSDIRIVQGLNLKSVIDLRTKREQREQGIFPLETIDVDFHHVSIVDATWSDSKETPQIDDPVDFLVWGYRDLLAIGPDKFALAIRILSNQANVPAVFHCAAGKDRTGILAALILSSVGVSDEIICGDYGLTKQAIERTIVWAQQHHVETAARWTSINPVYLAAEPQAMQVILNDLVAAHGSVRNYVRSLGVSEEELNDLSHLVVE
ncbi:MAG: tyrosine-protein phosphatase [Ilumatobacteraceae bacterium]